MGYVVGVLAAPHGEFLADPRGGHTFEWSTAAVAATAAGTVLLAAFTAALAYTTSGDVSATWELARLTRADQISRQTPIVYPVWIRLSDDGTIRSPRDDRVPGSLFPVTVRIRNVGPGPAIDGRLRLTYQGQITIEGEATQVHVVSSLTTAEHIDLPYAWNTPQTSLRASHFSPADFEFSGEYFDTQTPPESYPVRPWAGSGLVAEARTPSD